MNIKFRPHHFLCTLGFQGKGYSEPFVRNYFKILGEIEDEETLIEVVEETDTICAPCPHRRGKLCESQEKITALDEGHKTLLQIKAGDHLSWRELKRRIAQNITLEDFDRICHPCEWKKYGYCQAALKKLKEDFVS